jgi:hypothetical protein
MVSYFKTQWFHFLVGLVCFGVAVYYAFSPAGDTSTLEGVYYDVRMSFNFVMYLSLGLIWFITSFISFHQSCLQKLNERIEALETRAITDIEETSPNHYIVKRKLGPDKE